MIELLKLTLPALIIAGAMYLLVKNYLEKEQRVRALELRMKNAETVLPIRLQAYERITLLLERISPGNLLLRISGAGSTATEYHRQLLSEIREEFNHNLSQQVYMSDQAWQQVKQAREEIVALINKAYQQMPDDAKGNDLAKRILETILGGEQDPTARAISAIKQEIAQVF
ncbi:hypothetical protein [Pontibacter sp. SGAir0037]|uniref:DUF7935 family protein n=1 Tax=Pontibacter sp. SGAir0037 TaxID=2571030 RepID=UPI001F0E4C10|nr:hypothetical protein [Pontibacter sp. SGAir0037]